MFRVFRSFIICLSLSCLFALPGCGGGGEGPVVNAETPVAPIIRFYNASPDLGTAQFQAGSISVSLAPRELSGSLPLSPLTTTITVSIAGSATNIAMPVPAASQADSIIVTLYQTQLGAPRLAHTGRFRQRSRLLQPPPPPPFLLRL